MKTLKISLAAVAFLLTAGFSFAANHNAKSLQPCSTQPNSPANTQYETTVCTGPSILCCYVPNSSTQIQRPF